MRQVFGDEAREAQLRGFLVGGVGLAGELHELRGGPEGLGHVVDLVDAGLGGLQRQFQPLGVHLGFPARLAHLLLAALGGVAGCGEFGDVLR
jgi:hypothetical protein